MDNNNPQQAITQYYNELAGKYDADRFGNSYGQYLHKQEAALLRSMVPDWHSPVLSLGCGTGRFMELATHGADISPAMVATAKEKHPNKTFDICPATTTPYTNGFFNGAFCLHVLMHLPIDTIEGILQEAHRIIKPGGWLVVDFPNARRRQLLKKNKDGWHGNTSFTVTTFMQQIAVPHGWQLRKQGGLLLFPVHRFPRWLRPTLFYIDTWLCRTPLRQWASYHLVVLEKK